MKNHHSSRSRYNSHKPAQSSSGGSLGLSLLLLMWLFGGGTGSTPNEPRPNAPLPSRKPLRKSRLKRCLPPGANKYGELW